MSAHWNERKVISFDIETSGKDPAFGLQPWRVRTGEAWITSFVWTQEIDGEVIERGCLNPTREDFVEMLQFAIDNDCAIVGWNVTFDCAWLIAHGLWDLVEQIKWRDGMLLWRHFAVEPEYELARNKKKSYGLKACVAEVWPALGGYEAEVDFHDESDEARAKLFEYNKLDALYTLRLAKHWASKLTDRQLKAAVIEAACIPLIARANVEGLVVDVPATETLRDRLNDVAAQKLAELAQYGLTEEIMRSPIQLGALIYDKWGLECTAFTDTGARSTDKNALHDLAEVDPRCKTLREYRDALNSVTKFAEIILDSVAYNGDGRTRPQARVFSTYTGRFTYESSQGRGKGKAQTGFALQQMKRGKEYRAVIRAPEGMTIVEFDAASQEFRWLAVAAGDRTMMELCKPGADAHQYMADQIGAGTARALGKVANLSLGYRTSAKKLRTVARVQYGMQMSQDEADHIHKTYRETYKGVPDYWREQSIKVERVGYVETYAGRRVQMVGDWKAQEWQMCSTAINYRVQGTGADQKYLALFCLRDLLRTSGAQFAFDLHDGLYFYVPDELVDAFVSFAKAVLDTLPYEEMWGFNPPVPMTWDCKVGKTWGSLVERKFAVAESVGAGPAPETNPASDTRPSTEHLQLPVGDQTRGDKTVVTQQIGQSVTSPQVSNEDYARAIYGDWFESGWLCAGGKAGAGGWQGGFAAGELAKMTPGLPNYFSVASMIDGATTRNDENFARAHVFVVDDVCTKVEPEKVKLTLGKPNGIVETSQGNYQWHYFLASPCEDRWAWKKLRDDFKKHEEISGGADGNGLGAYFRLPVGAANKPGKEGFETKLAMWAPDAARMGVEEIAKLIGSDISEEAVAAYRAEFEQASRKIAEIDKTAIGADPVLALFSSTGVRVIDPRLSRQGYIAIECPWWQEHTDGNVDAGYNVIHGGFSCLHRHCEHRTIKDLREWLEARATPETKAVATALMFERGDTGEVQDLEPTIERLEDEFEERVEQLGRYVFVRTQNKFIDMETGAVLTKDAFNSTALEFAEAGASGKKAASAVFHNTGGLNVERMTYEPGAGKLVRMDAGGIDVSAYNTWRGSGISAYPLEPVADDDEHVRHWLDHVAYVIADEKEREFFLDWAAFVVTHQARKVNFAVLLRSAQGVGKDMMLQPLVALLGKHNVWSINAGALDGDFNDYVETRMVIVEELPPYHKKDVYEKLKALVSTAQEYMRVNKKQLQPYMIKNIQAWVLMSNHENAMALAEDDRRYFVVGSDAAKKEPAYYVQKARVFKDRVFLSKLMRWLNDRDLSKFNPMAAPPMTDAKRMMIQHAKDPIERWLDLVFGEAGLFEGRTVITTGELADEASRMSSSLSKKGRDGVDHQALAHLLKKRGGAKLARVRVDGMGQIVIYGLCNLELLGQLGPAQLAERLRAERDETSRRKVLDTHAS